MSIDGVKGCALVRHVQDYIFVILCEANSYKVVEIFDNELHLVSEQQ